MAGLYLHIPFCEHKCIYCDFYSIEPSNREGRPASFELMDSFLRALDNEIEMYSAFDEGSRFDTIFFGGGTPSLLRPETVKEILTHLGNVFEISTDSEITLETNPGTVDREKLEGYLNAGINRLSFGVQSFFDDDLRFLTRIHSSQQAKDAIRLAREVGFQNLSLDLIFALPGQTPDRWNHNLQEAIALSPDHISAYSLIVESNTPLARMVSNGLVSPLPIENEAELYEMTMSTLAAAGFEHYEVSNYARSGYRSRHNCTYWNHGGYVGFGPSAHSFWKRRRWWNIANLRTYCEYLQHRRELPIAGEEQLTDGQLIDEMVMLGMRGEGVRMDLLRSRFEIDLQVDAGSVLDQFVRDGFAVVDQSILRLTDKGFPLCDELSSLLLARLTPRNRLAIV